MQIKSTSIAFWSAVTALTLTLAATLVFGASHPGYSHIRDYISELGALEAPFGDIVSYALFLPIGLFSFIASVLLFDFARKRGMVSIGYIASIGISIGYLGAVAFRCDPGCPSVGSPAQQLHNLLGLVEYLAAGSGLLLAGFMQLRLAAERHFGIVSILAGAAVLFGFFLMASDPDNTMRGLWQRISEIALFSWLVIAARQADTMRDSQKTISQRSGAST